eukprot:g29226.t1
MNLGNEVLSLHWPRANQIIVMLGEKGGEAWLEQITVSSLESISRGSTLPLRAEKAGRCDVDDDIVALIDGKDGGVLWMTYKTPSFLPAGTGMPVQYAL